MNYESLEDAEMRARARDLGSRAAERLDVEGTAQAVVRRLRDEPHAVRRRVLPAWLAVAASVVLLLGGGVLWRAIHRPGGPVATTLAPAGVDLSTMSADQLRELLNAVEQPLDLESTGASEATLDDLTPGELRTLLGALEG